jgi:hypothetical protein
MMPMRMRRKPRHREKSKSAAAPQPRSTSCQRRSENQVTLARFRSQPTIGSMAAPTPCTAASRRHAALPEISHFAAKLHECCANRNERLLRFSKV